MPQPQVIQLSGSPAGRQEDFAPISVADLDLGPLDQIGGLYLHVPFCFHKCHYCDFYSIVDHQDRAMPFAERLAAEIRAAGERIAGLIQTIFVGGGTPTLLEPAAWEVILEALHDSFSFAADFEFTVEANPETVGADLTMRLAAGGVNRVSIGAQSFNPALLKALERWHNPASVGRAIEIVRRAGIDNINLDLINAIPGQTLDDVRDDLVRALALGPQHISCYTLMYEPNTPLTEKLRAGRIGRVDEDLEAAMYEMTMEVLAAAGFEHYEISNWARPGYQCRHNLLYWRNENWWPLGPSAAGHVNGVRWRNVPRISEYLQADPWPRVCDVEKLDDDARIGETLMLRLRLREGIELEALEALLTHDRSHRAARIETLIARDLLERTPTHLRLAGRGLLLADSVFAALL